MTSYREAGVDLGAASRHIATIAPAVTSTWDASVIGGFGGFAAGIPIPGDFRDPVLMMTTDGVGTKLELARLTDRWEGVGFDLVAMCVDDLAATGARPIGFVDYLAVGSLHATRDRIIVESIARACETAGCPLLGGETAEHPGVMPPDAVDLAGAASGIVERGRELDAAAVSVGDLVIGLRSPNLRSNGFSLVRSALGDDLGRHAEALIEPSVIYSPAVMQAIATGEVVSAAHVTGGGIVDNLGRAIPRELGVDVDTSAWEPPECFAVVASYGITPVEMFATFNMGIGFALVTRPDGVDRVLEATKDHSPMVIGEIRDEPGVLIR